MSTKKIVLENIPGVQIDFDMERERLDLKLKLRFSMYVFIYKNYMIFIQGGTLVDDTTKNSLEKVHNKYSAVYKLIANSFILNNMYQ